MNSTDKIYVLLDERTGFLSHTFTNVPCGYESSQDIEYIRKDALLEWAKERREAVIKEVVIQEGVRLGADAAFEELIDKLNAM